MDINSFLNKNQPLLDVRSPSEFLQGHIPGAFSFPLFSDDERKSVGTAYKKEGKDVALKLGLEFVGPKLLSFVEKAEKLAGTSKSVRLYCARGGMRSSSLAWLLQTSGFTCTLLDEGYKTFRGWVLAQFKIKYLLFVLGGFTGSGKTTLLHQLKRCDNQVMDLEQVAGHRGSAFGHLEGFIQPSSEQFENILAMQLSESDISRPIWIEDESRMIGSCRLPQDLWDLMTKSPFLWIEKDRKDRVQELVSAYGNYPQEELIQASKKLLKKLGAVKVGDIIRSIQASEFEVVASSVLEYYDKTYEYSCQKTPRARTNFTYTKSDQSLVEKLIKFAQEFQSKKI